MTSKINFYEEVQVVPNAKNNKYIGFKGVVMGISEEDGILYGYAVNLYNHEYSVYFDKEDLIPTGKRFKREDFY